MSAGAESRPGHDASRSLQRAQPRPSAREFVTGSPAAIVFGGAPPSWLHVIASSSLATLLFYGLAGVALSRSEGLWQHRAPRVAAPPVLVELLEPPPAPPPVEPPAPEPPPVAKPAPPSRLLEKAPPPAPTPEPPRDAPPPPAEAGAVVAAEPDAPVDFTSFDITTGKGARYSGGVTARSGTNPSAVHSAVIDRNGAPGAAASAVSLAKPVRLELRDWACPWPEEADVLAIEEERVVLRVDVDIDGHVTAASVVSDPGYGFGAAALRCARQHRFLPATDAAGRVIAASSPPIRVRFSR